MIVNIINSVAHFQALSAALPYCPDGSMQHVGYSGGVLSLLARGQRHMIDESVTQRYAVLPTKQQGICFRKQYSAERFFYHALVSAYIRGKTQLREGCTYW